MILKITSFICAKSLELPRSTAVEIPTAGAGASQRPWHQSFVADLLKCELLASSLEELPGLRVGAPLLAHNLACLVPRQVLCGQATDGLRLAATEHHCLGHAALCNLAHGLLLHRLHGLHGLHCLRHC